MCQRHHQPPHLSPTSFQNTNEFPSFVPLLEALVAINVEQSRDFQVNKRKFAVHLAVVNHCRTSLLALD